MSLSTTSALGDPGSHAFAVDEGRDMRIPSSVQRRRDKLAMA